MIVRLEMLVGRGMQVGLTIGASYYGTRRSQIL